jgi:hypothetical protein
MLWRPKCHGSWTLGSRRQSMPTFVRATCFRGGVRLVKPSHASAAKAWHPAPSEMARDGWSIIPAWK